MSPILGEPKTIIPEKENYKVEAGKGLDSVASGQSKRRPFPCRLWRQKVLGSNPSISATVPLCDLRQVTSLSETKCPYPENEDKRAFPS